MRVYIITNLINGKQYVGQTRRTVAKRFKGHARSAASGRKSIIHQAIAKHGIENFTVRELATATSQDELDMLEKQFIEQYNTLTPNGYNLKTGGQHGGSQYSQESRDKMAAAKIGTTASDTTRELMSQVHSERWSSQDLRDKKSKTSKKVWQDPDYRAKISKARAEYWSDPTNRERMAAQAKEFTTEEQKQKIGEAVKEAQQRPEVKEKMRRFYKSRQKPVIDNNGVCYDGIKEAAKILGIKGSSIVKALKGEYKSAGGRTWKYADET